MKWHPTERNQRAQQSFRAEVRVSERTTNKHGGYYGQCFTVDQPTKLQL